MKLSREQWHELSPLLDEVLDLEPPDRATWLEGLDTGRAHLRPMLERLLGEGRDALATDATLPRLVGRADDASPPPRTRPDAGNVGGYRLLKLIGQGGMGSVWLAEGVETTTRERVALKLPHPGAGGPSLAARLERESRILATLDHPGIARLLDAGVSDSGQPYLVMEYVTGQPLDAYCDDRRLDLEARVRLFLRVLEIAQYAHGRAVVHRDLKPSNILVTPAGEVRLLDFGIAKLVPDGEAESTELTRAGGRLLTVEYASPEQIAGRPVGAASDVYSLGVVLFRLVTGRRPYATNSERIADLERAVLRGQHLRASEAADDPSAAANRNAAPAELRQELAGALDEILARALRTRRSLRYSSCAAFARDLRRFLDGRKARRKGAAPRHSPGEGGGEGAGERRPLLHPYRRWSTRPSIAVLPFRTSGGGDEHRYFGEGITEAIIAALSRRGAAHVIAWSSTLRYRGAARNPRQIASELGVRHLLVGNARREAEDLRVSALLLDVGADRTVWGDRFSGARQDLFAMQERIVDGVAASIRPADASVEVEGRQAHAAPHFDAYDCVLRALPGLHLHDQTPDVDPHALIERAVAIDPSYARAHAHLAWQLSFALLNRAADVEVDAERALAVARRAVELDPHDAVALATAAHLQAVVERAWDDAEGLFARALAAEAGSAFAWALCASTFAHAGRGAEAIDALRNVWVLSPFDALNFFHWAVAGVAEFVSGRHQEAAEWLRRSRRANGRFFPGARLLAATLALSGDSRQARAVCKELLTLDPSQRLSNALAAHPFRRPEDLERLVDGLRSAGMPQ